MHCDLTFSKKLAGYSVWTYYVNDFDGVMNFECQDGKEEEIAAGENTQSIEICGLKPHH